MSRLFGTDGVRGVVNKDLTFDLVLKIGKATGTILLEKLSYKPKILIGKDTRISSDMLEAALIGGLCSLGIDVEVVGIIPTPAVAILVRKYGYDLGIMISASHNSVEFNGIKIFDSCGFKLSEQLEDKIENIVSDEGYNFDIKCGGEIGRVTRNTNSVNDYIDYIVDNINVDLTNVKIVVDCSNGSASFTATRLFNRLGATTYIINNNPDGLNINKNCGSTNIFVLSEYVKSVECDLGVAFDGDADRCLVVDENGDLVDGDKMIAIFAKYLKDSKNLTKDTVVVTLMTNLGFFEFAKNNNIFVKQSKVGDKYVLEEMVKGGFNLGGEQSGHIIFSDYCTTGDGHISAVMFCNILKNRKQSVSDLVSIINIYPQVIINVKIPNCKKENFNKDSFIMQKIDEYSNILGDTGRIIVRASGTEPLIRVMIEGQDLDVINRYAVDIAEEIKGRLS